MTDRPDTKPSPAQIPARETEIASPDLPAAAKRALAEAEQRRAQADEALKNRPREINGQAGPDPARYGDWEKGGIVSDF